MLGRLFLTLILTFVAELFLLLLLADKFGWRTVLAEVLLSGILGVMVVRWQNVKIFREVRKQLATGETPKATVMHGVLVLLAGVLLILPGLLGDILGVLLLVPLFRKLLGLGVALWFYRRFRTSSFSAGTAANPLRSQQMPEQQLPRIIDVQVIDRPEEDSQHKV